MTKISNSETENLENKVLETSEEKVSEENQQTENQQQTENAAENKEEQSKEDQIENFKKELEEMKNRYYRALADYQNLQRRSAKEILEARTRGVEDFLRKLLPVLDTMEKAVEQISKSNVDKKVIDGIEMFSIQFTDVLEKEGLKPISAIGQHFDPNFHEAMSKRTVEDVDDGIILTEYEKGYTFKDRVLRTAKVEINHR